MIDELNGAITDYRKKWDALIAKCNDKEFFKGLKPTSVAWKAVDIDDFDRRFLDLRAPCDQIHFGWVNERWLTTLHLKGAPLEWDIRLIKLMQRRPGSTDPVGLDHLDFLVPDTKEAEAMLTKEPVLKWTKEMNGEHCKWISVWFEGTEAKLRSDTVLDVCIAEMQDTNAAIAPEA
jgi:hypothetical protein